MRALCAAALLLALLGVSTAADSKDAQKWSMPDVDWVKLSGDPNKGRVYTAIAIGAIIFFKTKNIACSIIASVVALGFTESSLQISVLLLVYGYLTRNTFSIGAGAYLAYTKYFGGALF